MTQESSPGKQRSTNERIIFGSIVIIAGIILVLRNTGFPFPSFLFSWPMILIAIGVFSAIKDKFTNNTWWILIALGTFFLVSREFPDLELGDFFWPAIVIAIGLSILLGKSTWLINKTKRSDSSSTNSSFQPAESIGTNESNDTTGSKGEDVLDAAAIFGVVKKNIYSKNFKGGELVSVFGGTEVNLMHADFTGEMKLEIVNVFGATTLFVPSHWQIRTEAAAILGAIEDKRREPTAIQTDKVLIIEGVVLFGGIDIKSA
jgi:predicted membrane protein